MLEDLQKFLKKSKNKSKMPDGFFASIVNSSKDAIYCVDKNGMIAYWNEAAEKLYGYKSEEILGKKIQEKIIPSGKRKEFLKYKSDVRKGIIHPPLETLRIKKGGEVIHVELSISPMRNKKKKVIGVSVMARDISKRKHLEMEKNTVLGELDELVKIAPIGIAFLDHDFHYMKVNQALANMVGKPVNKMLGKTPFNVLPPQLGAHVMEKLKITSLMNEEIISEVEGSTYAHPQENKYWQEIYYPVQVKEGEVGIGVIVLDMTEQKLMDKRKDDFIIMASHELKTPVTTVKAFTQILRNLSLKDKNRREEYFERMESQINRLTKLINDLVDLSKIRSGRLSVIKEYFYFDDMVEEVLANFESISNSHRISLKGKTSQKVFADKDRIGQVLTNFINNAIKYSPNNENVEVSISNGGATVKLAVKDYGIGIAPQNQKKIFKSFYRVFDNDDIMFPGLGIGLFISAEIIKLHNGTIDLESRKGKGSTFYFTLPIK